MEIIKRITFIYVLHGLNGYSVGQRIEFRADNSELYWIAYVKAIAGDSVVFSSEFSEEHAPAWEQVLQRIAPMNTRQG